MVSRTDFARLLADQPLSHVDRAVAFLYYYRETQAFDERSARDLASDLHDEGFPRPNVTLLKRALSKSKFTTKGSQPGLYKLDLRRLPQLEAAYADFLNVRKVTVSGAVIPSEWLSATRPYLEKIVYQINAALIIETYLHQKRHSEIQTNGVFLMLDGLITHIVADSHITLSRNAPKTMREIKQLGDTAAHDRTYITPQVDIDDLKARYRRLIQELLSTAGISK